MIFGAALPLLGLLADAADGVDAVVDLGQSVADGEQKIELGVQIVVARGNARVFAHFERLGVGLIADLEAHLIAAWRSNRPVQRIIAGDEAFDLDRVRVFQIPDEAVAAGILRDARLLLLLVLLTLGFLGRLLVLGSRRLRLTAFGALSG